MSINRSKLVAMLASILILVATFSSLVWTVGYPTTITITPPSMTGSYTYTVFTDGATNYMKNESTGQIDYTSSNFYTVVQYAINNMTTSSSLLIKNGAYSFASTITVLTDNITIVLEPGVNLTYTGTYEAFKIGSDTKEVKHVQLLGNFAHLTRSVWGGTYGLHLENCHLCYVDSLIITKFALAELYLEGSWGSWVQKVEVINNPGAYGLLLRATQAGPFTANLGDFVTIKECWFQGTTAGICIRDNPEKVIIQNCNIHESAVGILDCGSRGLDIIGNYIEDNTGYAIYLKGNDSICGSTSIENNFLAAAVSVTLIYVDNAVAVNAINNNVNPPAAGLIFIDTAGAGSRQIYIDRNTGIPAWITWYDGDADSLIYHEQDLTAGGVPLGIVKPLAMGNGVYLVWTDNMGTQYDVMALAGTNVLVLKNFAGAGTIQLSPQVAGGSILFYDDGAHYRIGEWTKDWSMPVVLLGSDPVTSGWGISEKGQMWFNTSNNTLCYWDGEVKVDLGVSSKVEALPYSFLVYTDGTYYYAVNGSNWKVVNKSTNASAVINNAIGNCTNGDSVFTKDGLFSLDHTIVIPWSNFKFGGSGNGTILNMTTETTCIRINGTASNPLHDVQISDLQIKGLETGYGYDGVYSNFTHRLTVSHVDVSSIGVYDPTISSENGIMFGPGCQDCLAFDCTAYKCGTNGILMYGDSNYPVLRCKAIACKSYGNASATGGGCIGFSFSGWAQDCKYIDCDAFNLTDNGLKFEGFGATTPVRCEFQGGVISNVGLGDVNAIRIGDGSNPVSNCRVVGTTIIDTYTGGISITGENNTLKDLALHNIGVTHPGGGRMVISVKGNYTDISHIRIDADTGLTNVNYGLEIQSVSYYTKISDVRSSQCQYSGISYGGTDSTLDNCIFNGKKSENIILNVENTTATTFVFDHACISTVDSVQVSFNFTGWTSWTWTSTTTQVTVTVAGTLPAAMKILAADVRYIP